MTSFPAIFRPFPEEVFIKMTGMTGVMGMMRVRGASKEGEGGGEEEGKDEQTNKQGTIGLLS